MNDKVRLLLIWLYVMSALTFLLFALDKFRAKAHRRRIPEGALLAICLWGGAAGGLAGMLLFHHKTRKRPFPWLIPLLLLLQAALTLWVWLG